MAKVLVKNLEGVALDWAVAKCEGKLPQKNNSESQEMVKLTSELDLRIRRLAFVQEWSDAVIFHALEHLQESADIVFPIMQKAADDISLSALRGGDESLQHSAATALGFESFADFARFQMTYPTLSASLGAVPALEGGVGQVVACSSTEVVFDAEGGLMSFERARLNGDVAVGDLIQVGRLGAAVIIESADERADGSQRKLGEITQAKTWASLSKERGGIAFTHGRVFSPSTSWAQGGLIIDLHELCVGYNHQADPSHCPINDPATNCWARTTAGGYLSYARTPLIAAMRCYVTKQYGPEIEIPDELAVDQVLGVATAYRVRLENGDFWAEDEEVREFKSPAEVLQAVDEFLAGAKEGGLDYSQQDIEVVAPDGAVLNIAQVTELLAPGNTQVQAEMRDIGERRDALQQARPLGKHLEMYAELMDEAANLIERIPTEVFDSIEGRYPLCDELSGAAGMAREDVAAVKIDPRVVVSVSGGCVTNVYSDIAGVGAVLHDDDHLRELGRTSQERKTLLAAATAGCVDVEVTDSIDHLERVLETQDAPAKADGHEQQKKSESSGPSGP